MHMNLWFTSTLSERHGERLSSLPADLNDQRRGSWSIFDIAGLLHKICWRDVWIAEGEEDGGGGGGGGPRVCATSAKSERALNARCYQC